MDQVSLFERVVQHLELPKYKTLNIIAVSRFRAYALQSLVCDLIEIFKEIGRENSLLADRWTSHNTHVSISVLNMRNFTTSKNDEQSTSRNNVSSKTAWSRSVVFTTNACDMRLFMAIAGIENDGSTTPCTFGLKLCGESQVLALLAETFALWSQNVQVIFQ